MKIEFPEANFPVPKVAVGNEKSDAERLNVRYFFNDLGGTLKGRLQVTETKQHDWWIWPQDVVRSVSSASGDIRLIAARKKVPEPGTAGYPFAKNDRYDVSIYSSDQTHNIWFGDSFSFGRPKIGRLVKDAKYATKQGAGFENYPDTPFNGVAAGKKSAFVEGDIPGDWDNGIADIRDGPYINKPDEGDVGKPGVGNEPYKWRFKNGDQFPSETLFTPNRLISSAVTFGSLPSGVLADRPWQTLLFRPGPENHPGLGQPVSGPPYNVPPDHLLLDLFHMPVVEPYAISEPLSTAGRINMNYQIAPFTYFHRDTGMRAVLKSEKVITIENSELVAGRYKSKAPSELMPSVLSDINLEATLQKFQERFDQGDLFRSATEICSIDIVPENYTGTLPVTRASMDAFWKQFALTGDNSRECIYATLYPRFTTKSNTFLIHFRVQTLRKSKGSAAEWNETKDVVTGEFRGSQLVERYIDPNDSSLPDFAADPNSTVPIDRHYRFRTLYTRKFAP